MDEAIYEVLTKEQKQRVQQILEERERRRNEELQKYIKQQKLRRLKNRQEEISWAYFMGYITIILLIILCGLSIFFIPGKYVLFDSLMVTIILLTAFCVFTTFLFALN